MSDLIEKLRLKNWETLEVASAAADRIEGLEAENNRLWERNRVLSEKTIRDRRIEELEAALEHIKQHQDVVCKGNPEFSATWNIANNTLDRLPKGK